MSTEIKVPTLGESVTEATIGQWFKKPGDRVEMDETLAELETDKVTVEVPAPAAGVLQDITVPEGETVAVGTVIGSIGEGSGSDAGTTAPTEKPKSQEAKADAGGETKADYGGGAKG
ncbi:MAG: biotin/lipoyl-containing protein, partial [Aurantimonas coralicida]|nr:biotin/lipoyl-containing protein [Aurantimonas coralicida]